MRDVQNVFQKMEFYRRRLAGNPEFWTPIRTLVEKLKEQGVLEMFIRSDKIEELNALLDTKLIMFEPYVTKDTYIEVCSIIFIRDAIGKIYDKKQDDVTEQEIKDEVTSFVNNTSWAKIFENLWAQSCIIIQLGYKMYVELYKKVPGTTEEDINNLDKLLKAAFPMGMLYEMPTKQWVNNNQVVRDAIHMSVYFDDEYIDDVFCNIQHMSKKDMNADTRETTDFQAISCVELQLMAQFSAECNKPMEEVDAKEVHDYVERLKEEKTLYLMAMYYVYARKFFVFMTNQK